MTEFPMGGAGGNAFSFGLVGTQPGGYVQGIVLHGEERQSTNFGDNKPEFWDDGRPKMQYVVTLQTELRDPGNPADDGKRELYLDGRRKPNDNGTKSRICAVLDAVKAAKGDTNLEYGAKLTVQWISGMGNAGDPRNYQAWYERPAMPMEQPPQHVPAAPPAPVSGPPSPVQSPGPPPAWAQPAAAAPPVTPPAQPQLPIPAAAAPPVAPPAIQPGQTWTQPQAPTPAVQAANPYAPPVTSPAPAQAPAAQVLPPLTPETVAALQAAGQDPAAYYGPGWMALITPA